MGLLLHDQETILPTMHCVFVLLWPLVLNPAYSYLIFPRAAYKKPLKLKGGETLSRSGTVHQPAHSPQ